METIARNRKAFHDYDIIETVEAGVELRGSEVKSIRAGHANITESYAHCINGEIFLNHLHVNPYDHQGALGPDPYRKRKLLLHKKQVIHLCSEVERKKLTLVPLSVYFKKQWVKVELGLCRGRKKYDKRQVIAEQDAKRRIAAVMKVSRQHRD